MTSDQEIRPAGGRRTPRRVFRALLVPRLRRVDLAVAVLLGLLGFAAAVQVRSTQDVSVLASARQEDLVRILRDLTNRSERLRQEVASLTDTQRRLTTGTDRTAAALAEARRRTQVLGVLAGTVPARGPGVLLTVTDPARKITAATLLDALEELRDAGAEAVQLEGPVEEPLPTSATPRSTTRVRVIASTSLLDGQGGVLVDGVLLRAPYGFTIVGDPSTLASALRIPGGVVDTVARAQGTATIVRREQVVVDALRSLSTPRYARPDPVPTPSG